MGAGAARLALALALAIGNGTRPRRAPAGALARSTYLDEAWEAQRQLHRSKAQFRILVSGRGVGKTHGCAYELIQIVMEAPPGSEGAVLAPTLTHAEAAISKLREVAEPLGLDVEWVASKRRLMLPGGRSVKVFSADRKETVRGPSLVALWIDEGAFLSVKAVEASLPALRARGVKTKLLISTTPAGKNWVWQWWEEAGKGGHLERFRFRGTDSPFQDQTVIELARRTMSPERFAQEYFAEFVDNLLLVFPDRDGLFVEELPARKKARCWLGVDLGKKDFTACTLLNEWQEGAVIDRWNGDTPGFSEATYWAQTYERVAGIAQETGATVVLDTGGPGGAAGAVLAEHLRSLGVEVIEVATNQVGTKAKIVEQAKADVQWKKVKLLVNQHTPQLDYEMSRFQGVARVIHGKQVNIYEGPQLPGEFDDVVISFCLANWGRVHDETPPDGGDGGIAGFKAKPPAPSQPRGQVGSRGYIFR